MNRRRFLALTTVIIANSPFASLAGQVEKTGRVEQDAGLPEPWKTIDVVQNHLFPFDANSPGARDIHALAYLQLMLSQADVPAFKRQQIMSGEKWLNDLSRQTYHRKFAALDENQREKLLRRVEQSRAGERWLSWLLSYLIEALLSDPVYGGNPDGNGWKWLQHQPGFPHPPPAKRYFNIGYGRSGRNRKRQTKA